jgi:hypothetical protein
MEVPELSDSANAIFPGLVLSLFAAEIAREEAEQAAARSGAPLASLGLWQTTGVCSSVQGFIDQVLNSVFNALHVNFGSSLPGVIIGGIFDFILGNARRAIRELINRLLAPVMDLIKTIAGVLGTASMIVSAIRPWSVRMTLEPASTRLAVGSEPPLEGTIRGRADLGGLDEWPADVADCAAQSGTPLPPLRPVGAACTWEVVQSRGPNSLITTTQTPAVLDNAAAAQLAYATRSEDEETAKGNPVNGWARVTMTIRRPELNQLRQTIINLVFAQLPAIVTQFVQPILGPIANDLLGKLQSMTDSKATAVLPVLYHERKEEPTPAPTREGDAPASILLEVYPLEGSSSPAIALQTEFTLDAATCDGERWEGTLRLLFTVDTVVVSLNLDETLPISWDFAGGDSATARSGPFQSVVVYQSGSRDPYAVMMDVDISRGRGDDGRTATLTFGMTATVDWAGEVERGPITNAANLGTPIAVKSGGDC